MKNIELQQASITKITAENVHLFPEKLQKRYAHIKGKSMKELLPRQWEMYEKSRIDREKKRLADMQTILTKNPTISFKELVVAYLSRPSVEAKNAADISYYLPLLEQVWQAHQAQ